MNINHNFFSTLTTTAALAATLLGSGATSVFAATSATTNIE